MSVTGGAGTQDPSLHSLSMKEPSFSTEGFTFAERHIGPTSAEIENMLEALGVASLDELIDKTVPSAIRTKQPVEIGQALSENDALSHLRAIASKNSVQRSLIGLGYYGTFTPPVILRNILENPGWYTAYTPYQAEIAQGRLEALLNFQTMICDLTGMELANASLLDEGTAAAEAMTLCAAVAKGDRSKFFVSQDCHPQSIEVVETRASALDIEVVVGSVDDAKVDESYFGVLLQYPCSDGGVVNYEDFIKRAKKCGALAVVAADLLSLTILRPPGEFGADVVIGSSQRFGVPLGFGGPHAAFFATLDAHKRHIPGRLIGVSKDSSGKSAFRLALQTREQHIKRDRATSNICTAQVLLAVIASMYAVYHGPKRLRRIAVRVHAYARLLASGLERLGYKLCHQAYFDTVCVEASETQRREIADRSRMRGVNFRYFDDGRISISLDELSTSEEVRTILEIFSGNSISSDILSEPQDSDPLTADAFARKSDYLTHPVFNSYHSETELLRYLYRLMSKDIALTHSMIPLGSCTMKLNATAEMIPVTWPEFGNMHPFAPRDQASGYMELISELERLLCEITGFSAVSLQPNSGAQGEYAGLLAIRGYHHSRGDKRRKICLIPESAHGTNPASAVMAGMQVVKISCDESGNIDVADLKEKAEKHKSELAALMVTYPSTHGVFEESIKEICDVVHECGGQVYMDGANLNAQVGLCRPGEFGADVAHLNLHKTFCIPHGGGGPGVGPIGVLEHLKPFLPGSRYACVGESSSPGAVAAAPWGSAGILPISYTYLKMMGSRGIKRATEVAILNANYIAKRLEGHFDVLYKGAQGFVAHECILDLRKFKRTVGIEVGDVAKRLMDYGFHAPTVSWPVVETLMVEPTESESQQELDRFCDAMIAIRAEIAAIERGEMKADESPLRFAPHTAEVLLSADWDRAYSREQAAYPAAWLREDKYWPPVGRIDAAFGDRNLFCSCVPM